MWTHTFNLHIDSNWQPNHFVSCLETKEMLRKVIKYINTNTMQINV